MIKRGLPAFADVLGSVQQISIRDLCDLAGVPCKVSGPSASESTIYLVSPPSSLKTAHHFMDDGRSFCLINRGDLPQEEHVPEALRVLELLAYAFNHYAARECVRGRFE